MGVSVTVENIDPDVLGRLQLEALRRGTDVGMVIKQLIRDNLSPALPSVPTQMHHDLDTLAGTWSAAEADIFNVATSDLARLDEDLWK